MWSNRYLRHSLVAGLRSRLTGRAFLPGDGWGVGSASLKDTHDTDPAFERTPLPCGAPIRRPQTTSIGCPCVVNPAVIGLFELHQLRPAE